MRGANGEGHKSRPGDKDELFLDIKQLLLSVLIGVQIEPARPEPGNSGKYLAAIHRGCQSLLAGSLKALQTEPSQSDCVDFTSEI